MHRARGDFVHSEVGFHPIRPVVHLHVAQRGGGGRAASHDCSRRWPRCLTARAPGPCDCSSRRWCPIRAPLLVVFLLELDLASSSSPSGVELQHTTPARVCENVAFLTHAPRQNGPTCENVHWRLPGSGEPDLLRKYVRTAKIILCPRIYDFRTSTSLSQITSARPPSPPAPQTKRAYCVV